jgi:hypothetical protein
MSACRSELGNLSRPSQFKTMKYCPAFPGRFGSVEDARAFCEAFFSSTTTSTVARALATTRLHPCTAHLLEDDTGCSQLVVEGLEVKLGQRRQRIETRPAPRRQRRLYQCGAFVREGLQVVELVKLESTSAQARLRRLKHEGPAHEVALRQFLLYNP